MSLFMLTLIDFNMISVAKKCARVSPSHKMRITMLYQNSYLLL